MRKNLKPNGISHTVYPDNPAKDYNEWMEHITAKSIERDADIFKQQLDALWADFKKQIQNHAK
jgi:hypothetical protein